jgi:hypothetical protein
MPRSLSVMAKALVRFPTVHHATPRCADAIARLEVAGKAIGAEMRRRGLKNK